MGLKQLYNDTLRKLPNEYRDVYVMELGPLLYKNLYKFEKKLHNVRSIHIFAIVFVGIKFSSHFRVIFRY